MNAGPNSLKAQAAWNGEMPDWVAVLASMCDQESQKRAAKRTGYSATVINQVLANTYTGDLKAVQKAIEGAFLSVKLICPVLGEIPAQVCITKQRQPLRATNPMRVRLWHACRKCPNFRGKGEE
jgi:hypothetical protein